MTGAVSMSSTDPAVRPGAVHGFCVFMAPSRESSVVSVEGNGEVDVEIGRLLVHVVRLIDGRLLLHVVRLIDGCLLIDGRLLVHVLRLIDGRSHLFPMSFSGSAPVIVLASRSRRLSRLAVVELEGARVEDPLVPPAGRLC